MDEEKLRTIIYTTIKDFFNTEIVSALLDLLKASEERIDETNKMIARLSEYATTTQQPIITTSHHSNSPETKHLMPTTNLPMSTLNSWKNYPLSVNNSPLPNHTTNNS